MPTCEEVSRLVSESLDRSLSFRERIGLRIHFFMCEFCRRFREQISFIREVLSHYQRAIDDGTAMSPEIALSPGAREKTRSLLSEK